MGRKNVFRLKLISLLLILMIFLISGLFLYFRYGFIVTAPFLVDYYHSIGNEEASEGYHFMAMSFYLPVLITVTLLAWISNLIDRKLFYDYFKEDEIVINQYRGYYYFHLSNILLFFIYYIFYTPYYLDIIDDLWLGIFLTLGVPLILFIYQMMGSLFYKQVNQYRKRMKNKDLEVVPTQIEKFRFYKSIPIFYLLFIFTMFIVIDKSQRWIKYHEYFVLPDKIALNEQASYKRFHEYVPICTKDHNLSCVYNQGLSKSYKVDRIKITINKNALDEYKYSHLKLSYNYRPSLEIELHEVELIEHDDQISYLIDVQNVFNDRSIKEENYVLFSLSFHQFSTHQEIEDIQINDFEVFLVRLEGHEKEVEYISPYLK